MYLCICHRNMPLQQKAVGCAQAADDPIAPKAAMPVSAIQANPHCVLAITPAGGHLGWCSGPGAPFGEQSLSSLAHSMHVRCEVDK